jgi:hypothetical protein
VQTPWLFEEEAYAAERRGFEFGASNEACGVIR